MFNFFLILGHILRIVVTKDPPFLRWTRPGRSPHRAPKAASRAAASVARAAPRRGGSSDRGTGGPGGDACSEGAEECRVQGGQTNRLSPTCLLVIELS